MNGHVSAPDLLMTLLFASGAQTIGNLSDRFAFGLSHGSEKVAFKRDRYVTRRLARHISPASIVITSVIRLYGCYFYSLLHLEVSGDPCEAKRAEHPVSLVSFLEDGNAREGASVYIRIYPLRPITRYRVTAT